jgi:hypothetical protein
VVVGGKINQVISFLWYSHIIRGAYLSPFTTVDKGKDFYGSKKITKPIMVWAKNNGEKCRKKFRLFLSN